MSSKKKQQNIYASAAKRMAEYQAEQAQASANDNRRLVDVRRAAIAVIAAVALALTAQWTYFSFGPGFTGSSVAATIDINGAKLPITLDKAAAPKAVDNFVTLAQKGFFDGISCHRLTTEGIYVLQCGDPKGDGTGGPGYSWGPIENAPTDNVYKTGVLAMARQGGNAQSMGSQFFIVYADSTIPADAAGGYTVFGTIGNLAGIQNIIDAGSDNSNAQGDGKPKLKTTINSVSVN